MKIINVILNFFKGVLSIPFVILGYLLLIIIKAAIPLGLGILLAHFICNIQAHETYCWIEGIWHGMFFIPNFVRHLFDSDILYKASHYSAMYNIFWWSMLITGQLPLLLWMLNPDAE